MQLLEANFADVIRATLKSMFFGIVDFDPRAAVF
jgi:hypothetical protein